LVLGGNARNAQVVFYLLHMHRAAKVGHALKRFNVTDYCV
jgi:hypothetical protein